ncbi:hypothetical protein EXIGLDRAFT_716474 [Exidia glandulosa HHB12029]|uniref:Uncharacterized protein n=1 Tax=Exidia glandulosa HHB12029 TaxID=1314781 RepID=A0A166BK33_EXIGL|nr:hypothetical protein EXIGLDRAFT_716474 [Exidia glandulosa HHB12029]
MSPPRVFLERSLHPPNADGLLLTNRLIAHETRAIIERTKPTYKLDLLFVDELQFWPTWTCLPVSAQFIDSVHVSISCLETQVPVLRAFLWSFRGPPQSMWALYVLLEFYLEPGLTHNYNNEEGQTRRPIVVRNITLDFIDLHDAPAGANLVTTPDIRTFMATTTSALPLQYPDYTTWHRRASSRHPVAGDVTIAAPWFARIVRDFLRLLLQDVWSIRYAGVLHRRVGVIDIAVSGGRVDTCDITVALALLDLRGPPANYRSFTPRFLNHMRAVLQARKHHGLPVPSEI